MQKLKVGDKVTFHKIHDRGIETGTIVKVINSEFLMVEVVRHLNNERYPLKIYIWADQLV